MTDRKLAPCGVRFRNLRFRLGEAGCNAPVAMRFGTVSVCFKTRIVSNSLKHKTGARETTEDMIYLRSAHFEGEAS